jgi:hypothetical protein
LIYCDSGTSNNRISTSGSSCRHSASKAGRRDGVIPSDNATRNWRRKPLAAAFTLSRGLLQGCEDTRDVLQKECARASQPCAGRGACKKHHAQFFFKLIGSARQRRLLDVQPLGRAGAADADTGRPLNEREICLKMTLFG